jgi:hypothetical protein
MSGLEGGRTEKDLLKQAPRRAADPTHWVRDVTLDEDAHQARTGNGPAVAAVLRNTAIGYHRSNGEPNIARATRHANRRPHDLISAVTSGSRTQ